MLSIRPSIRRFHPVLLFLLITLTACAVGASDLADQHLNGKVKTVKTESIQFRPDRQEYVASSYEITLNPEGYIVEEATYGPNGALRSRTTDEREGDRVLSTTKWNSRNEPVNITTYKYAPDGHVGEVTTTGEDGALEERAENTVRANGSGELRTFGPDGILKSVKTYIRSEDGKTTTSETTENGKVVAREESRLGRDRKTESRNYRELDNSKIIREFNRGSDHIVVISELQQDGSRISTVTVTNPKGMITEDSTERIYPDGKISSSKSLHKYDRHGDETELAVKFDNGKCISRTKRLYAHDPQGNWTKREDWSEGCGMKPQLSFVQRRIITYY